MLYQLWPGGQSAASRELGHALAGRSGIQALLDEQLEHFSYQVS
jgi:hypothetical protein